MLGPHQTKAIWICSAYLTKTICKKVGFRKFEPAFFRNLFKNLTVVCFHPISNSIFASVILLSAFQAESDFIRINCIIYHCYCNVIMTIFVFMSKKTFILAIKRVLNIPTEPISSETRLYEQKSACSIYSMQPDFIYFLRTRIIFWPLALNSRTNLDNMYAKSYIQVLTLHVDRGNVILYLSKIRYIYKKQQKR